MIIESTVLNPVAIFVFAHGAGADMSHEFMEDMTNLLNKNNINVIRFNFPYMVKRKEDGKRRPPDRMPKLINSYVENIESIQSNLPLFIGGKSMGGRVAAEINSNLHGVEIVSEKLMTKVKGVICLGYPFHPPKKTEKLRLEPLKNPHKKVLIVQGERDTLGNKTEISEYVFSSKCELCFLTDGDHSLKPRVKSGITQSQNLKSAVNCMVSFINENR